MFFLWGEAPRADTMRHRGKRQATMNRRILPALVVSLALSTLPGCGRYYWSKPGATVERFDADSRACLVTLVGRLSVGDPFSRGPLRFDLKRSGPSLKGIAHGPANSPVDVEFSR